MEALARHDLETALSVIEVGTVLSISLAKFPGFQRQFQVALLGGFKHS